MSETKQETIGQIYELLAIVRLNVLQKPAQDLIKKLVEDAGGKVNEVDFWGKRELTYMIDREESANYVFFGIELPKEKVASLKKEFQREKDILRVMLTKVEE
ncbi:30S ribosomal protein S6 [Patescibacteria group bacterium]|nr:30S ribosomal protein S6 [Patescibacteria group bacterium]